MKYRILISIYALHLSICASSKDFASIFHSWWRKMEIQKHFPLTENGVYRINKNSDTLINYKCMKGSGDKLEMYGLFIQNNTVLGKGRIKVNDDRGSSYGCIKLSRIFNIKILSIRGTFIEGQPHGPLELELANNNFVMGYARNGQIFELVRAWKARDKELFSVCSTTKNRCWKKCLSNFIYTRNSEQGNPSVLILKSDNSTHSGYLWEILYVVEDFQGTQIQKISDTKANPMLDVTYSLSLNTGVRFSLLSNSSYGVHNDEVFSVKTGKWRELGFKKVFREWFSNIIDTVIWKTVLDKRPVLPTSRRLLRDMKVVDDTHFRAYVLNEKKVSKFILWNPSSAPYNGRIQCILEGNEKIVVRDFLVPGVLEEIDGYFSNGILGHFVFLKFKDKRRVYAQVVDGALQGAFLIYGIMPLLPMSLETLSHLEYLNNLNGNLHFIIQGSISMVGNIYNGSFDQDPLFVKSIGGNFYYLEKRNGVYETVAFIYPNLENVLIGKFEGLVMKSGFPGTIKKYRKKGLSFEVVFEKMPGIDDKEIYFSPPTNESFGEGPLQLDFFERNNVEIKRSNIPESGDGVFTLRHVKKGELICLYSGIKLRNEEEKLAYYNGCTINKTMPKDMNDKCSKYAVEISTKETLLIHPDQDTEGSWQPTFGQKINSQFDEWGRNAYLADFEHPKYGLIIGAFAEKDISPGEEVYVDYGYNELTEYSKWYFDNQKKYLEWKKQKEKNLKTEL